MRLAIFGATGRTGRVVVERALDDGHEVTALTRDAARIPPRDRLRVVAGDVRDPTAVGETVAGAEAVISVLGRRRRGPETCTEGVRTILAATAAGGPRRLVVLTNYGVAETRGRGPYVAVSWLLERAVLLDKEHMEALLRAGDAEWTLVRAPVLTNGPRTDAYRAGPDLRLGFTSRVSRADLAGFLLGEAQSRAHVRRAVAITS